MLPNFCNLESDYKNWQTTKASTHSVWCGKEGTKKTTKECFGWRSWQLWIFLLKSQLRSNQATFSKHRRPHCRMLENELCLGLDETPDVFTEKESQHVSYVRRNVCMDSSLPVVKLGQRMVDVYLFFLIL